VTAMRPARPQPDIPRPDATKGTDPLWSNLSKWIGPTIRTLLRWEDRRRQRRALHYLSDAMLKDIGLSRADVENEAAKPFWLP
jgi:uncharacterized protein YjiS (DUF1127 family)